MHSDLKEEGAPLLRHEETEEQKSHARDVHALSFAFLFVSSAYSATQNLETTVNTRLGSTSMGILYVSFAMFSLVGLPLVRSMGLKRSLLLGTTGYWLFIASNLRTSWYTMIPASLYLGFASAIIWVAQGTYLTCAARSHAKDYDLPEAVAIGNFNGEFWGMFASTQVIGNLLSLALLKDGKERGDSNGTTLLFTVFLGSVTLGAILMCFLTRRGEDETRQHSSPGIVSIFKSVVSPMSDMKMLLILPFLAYSGLQRSFVWAVFTKRIVMPALGVAGVGGAMAIYGASGVLSSLASGRLTSRFSSVVWIISSGALIQILVLLWLLLKYSEAMGPFLPLLMGALLGIGEGIFSTELCVLLGMLFRNNTEGAFSQFRFWQCSATAVVFFLGNYITLEAMCTVMFAAVIIAESCFIYLTHICNAEVEHCPL